MILFINMAALSTESLLLKDVFNDVKPALYCYNEGSTSKWTMWCDLYQKYPHLFVL